MDPQPPSMWQLPQSLSDVELDQMLDPNGLTPCLSDDMLDFSPIEHPGIFAPDPTGLEYPQWMSSESHHFQSDEQVTQDPQVQASSDLNEFSSQLGTESSGIFPPQPNLNNVSQWLDGAYRPPAPCTHCRRHRLQCLIIRTTSANPNPKTSCSSCVALFRECSLAKGEKRHPSGFETLVPVLGHLHGVPEDETAMAPSVDMDNEGKEPKQFIRKGARVLREWFYHNQEHPYPTEAQKNQLSLETGFSQKRISTWFANARRRQKQKIQPSGRASTSRARAGSPLITSTLASLTPMERWQASPPEDEPVPEAAIQNAISSNSIQSDDGFDLFQFNASGMDFFDFDESSSHLASSVSSIGSKASETSDSGSSIWSHHSHGDSGLPSQYIKHTKPKRIHGRQGSRGDFHFQCTFCAQSFRKKHDWSRHEKSVHLTLDSWICAPDLNSVQQCFDLQSSECAFCDVSFPTPDHWDDHDFHVCADKPTKERSFSRKDYLWQHLRKFHGCTKLPVSDLDEWRGSGASVKSRCGFCDCSLPTWAARAEHLAGHFKKGSRMDEWEGDWGLDASIMGNLRNAVLPSQRLIGLSI